MKVSWRRPTHTSKASKCLHIVSEEAGELYVRIGILGKIVEVFHVSDNKYYITDCVVFFIGASELSLSASS